MLRIRLARGGKKKDPFYRIVVIEKHRKRGGKPVDIVGHYHPLNNDIVINRKKIDDWIKQGAGLSDSVRKLIQEK